MEINNTPQTVERRYLNKAEAADSLGISTRTLDSWLSRKLIPYLKIGRTVRFDPEDLRRTLLKTCRVGGGQ